MNVVFVKKRWIYMAGLCFALMVSSILYFQNSTLPVTGEASEEHELYTFHMVTGEFATKTKDGKEIEAYRWDPGTIVVPKGKEITLSIYGVNGEEHPFFIEGTNVKGTVKKGEETVINMKFSKEGTYRLICTTHPDKENNGPMIAYIVVD